MRGCPVRIEPACVTIALEDHKVATIFQGLKEGIGEIVRLLTGGCGEGVQCGCHVLNLIRTRVVVGDDL